MSVPKEKSPNISYQITSKEPVLPKTWRRHQTRASLKISWNTMLIVATTRPPAGAGCQGRNQTHWRILWRFPEFEWEHSYDMRNVGTFETCYNLYSAQALGFPSYRSFKKPSALLLLLLLEPCSSAVLLSFNTFHSNSSNRHHHSQPPPVPSGRGWREKERRKNLFEMWTNFFLEYKRPRMSWQITSSCSQNENVPSSCPIPN